MDPVACGPQVRNMRKDSSDVTRELKLALIVGFALVLTVAILVSDHLSKARNATLANVTGNSKVTAKVPEQPIRSPEDILPPSMTPAVEVATTGPAAGSLASSITEPTQVAAAPEASNAAVPPGLADKFVAVDTPALMPVVIGQTSGSKVTTPVKPEVTNTPTRTVAYLPPHSGTSPTTPQELVKSEVQKKAEATKPAPLAAIEKTYKVAEGDTFFALSKKFYGTTKFANQLASANSGRLGSNNVLRAGASIVIPSKESLTGKPETASDPKVASKTPAKVEAKPVAKPVVKTEAKVEASKVKSYQVRPGDTLSNIARNQLGSPARSTEIASLNRMDPEDDLLAGAILKIPAR